MSKKKETIEELVEKALILEEEQPYSVPENWTWVHLGSVANFINGDRGKNYPSQKDFITEGIPFINAGHLQNGKISMSKMNYISSQKYNSLGSGKVFNNDVLYCLRGTLGKTALVSGFENGAIASSLVILRPYEGINSSFLFYYLISSLGQSMIKIYDNGSAQPNLSAGNVKKYMFPLPPLGEQKRIAEKVEQLLSKIGAAGQLIEDVRETFEFRREAFVNDLFKDSSNKQIVNISDVADVKGGKRLPKGDILVNENTGFPYIKAGDLKNGTVLLDKLQFLLPSTQEKIKNYIVSAGDVYITIVGACIGDVGVIPQEVDGANLTENAAKLTNLKGCLPEYLALWLSSNKAQNIIKESIASATLGKLSLTRIKSLPIPLYDIESQMKIVDKYQNFMEKENKIAQNLDKIDLDVLKQSILSKAFKGALGTNDPSEENANELLKEVLHVQLT